MAKKRRSYPKSANMKYKFDAKDNSIFEDKSSKNVIFRIISDPKEPTYKHEINKEKIDK